MPQKSLSRAVNSNLARLRPRIALALKGSALIAIVWSMGYYGLSISWPLFALFVYLTHIRMRNKNEWVHRSKYIYECWFTKSFFSILAQKRSMRAEEVWTARTPWWNIPTKSVAFGLINYWVRINDILWNFIWYWYCCCRFNVALFGRFCGQDYQRARKENRAKITNVFAKFPLR